METVIRNIVDLNGNDRSAAERLVGHALQGNQQLLIQVVNRKERDARLPFVLDRRRVRIAL